MNRVFITGMGAHTSLGNDKNTIFNALLENKTAVKYMPEWEQYNGLFSHCAAPAIDYDSKKIPRNVRRSMSRMSEMSLLATQTALQEAALPMETLSSPRNLICFGSTTGSPETLEAYFKKLIEKNGPEGQLSTSFFKVMNHSISANVALGLNFIGPLLSVSSACSSSAQATILGYELISSGVYDLCIVGGADELHYTTSAVFDIAQAASRKYNKTPELTPRPFDLNRDGLIVSEGAAVLILESEAHAKKRGVEPCAEILSGTYQCDSTHMTQTQCDSMKNCMMDTIKKSQVRLSDISYVNAHATGTLLGDKREAQAISQIFGNSTPVSSLKGHFGHSMAACGILEIMMSIEMMKKNVLIPTRNLVDIDPECSRALLIKENVAVQSPIFLSNNFAFGGLNASILISTFTSGS